MPLKDKTYNVLKFIAQIFLPALGALYFALAGLWHLPSPEQVIGTVVAVDTFLGVLLGISQVGFNKQIAGGVMNVSETGRKKTFTLDLDDHPDTLIDKKQVRLRVAQHPRNKTK